MERGRKSRRGRGRSHCNHIMAHSYTPPQNPKQSSFLSTLYSFFIMSTLIALIYLMLQYHCQNCKEKCNINNITKSLDDIANNISLMKASYQDLELKIARFAKELPKLEGQIDILESLASTIENTHFGGWDPKTQIPLPNVDVFLNKSFQLYKNNMSDVVSSITPAKPIPVSQD